MRHVASAPANLAMMAHSFKNQPSNPKNIAMYIPSEDYNEHDFGKQTHELECEKQKTLEEMHTVEIEKTHETNILENSNNNKTNKIYKIYEVEATKKIGKDDTFYELVSCMLNDGCVVNDAETKTILTYILNSIYEGANKENIENKTFDIFFIVVQRFVVSYAIHHIIKDVSTIIHEITM